MASDEEDENYEELATAIRKCQIQQVVRLTLKSSVVNSTDKNFKTPLYWACFCGTLETVKHLVRRGAKVDICNIKGETPLTVAAASRNVPAVLYLLESGANINKFEGNGLTPLHQAVAAGHLEITEILIERGACVNMCIFNGNTPLFFARNNEVIMHLINSGADANIVNNEGKTALDVLFNAGGEILTKYTKIISPHMIKTYNLKMIKTLISTGANVNKHDENNETPLLRAVKTKNLELIKCLLDNGAEFSVHSALVDAIKTCNKEIVELLLNRGANVNRQYKSGTPLFKAVEVESYEIVKLLLENGAHVNISDQTEFTPLTKAMQSNNYEIGANANQVDEHQNCPLLLAVNRQYKSALLKAIEKQSLEILKLLIDKGADVNLIDQSGYTPLTKAVLSSFEILKLLIENGADVNLSDQNGYTPLTKAVLLSNYQIGAYLIEKGADGSADVNQVDTHQNSPLLLAAKNDNLNYFDYLIKFGGNVEQVKKELNVMAKKNEDLDVYLHNLKLKEKTTTTVEEIPGVSTKKTIEYFSGHEQKP